MNLSIQSRIGAFIALSLFVCPAALAAEDIDEVRPRGFTSTTPAFRGFDRKRREIQLPTPEEAQKAADTAKTSLDSQNQKYSYKKEGNTHTIVVDSTKKTMVFKADPPGQKKQEIQTALTLTQIFPNNKAMFFHMSRLYERNNDWAKAAEFYKKACSMPTAITAEDAALDSKSNTAARESQRESTLAYYELMMKHYETAIRMLTKAIALQPNYATNYRNRAQAYRMLHKQDLAAKDDSKVLQLLKKNEGNEGTVTKREIHGSFSLMMIEMGSLDQALVMADKTLQTEPNSAVAHLTKARTLLRMGKYDKALPEYKKTLAVTNNSAPINTEMATAASLAKQGPPAYGDLKQIAFAPPSPFARFGRGGNQMPVEKIAADHKGDFRVYSAIAAGLKEQSLMKPLDVELNKMLLIAPADSSVIGKKIEASEALRDWPQAEKYCITYINQLAKGTNGRMVPEFIQYVYSVRALARRAQKKYDGAIDDDSTLLKLTPNSAMAYRDRGDCYRMSGKYDLALIDYTKAISIDNTNSGGAYLRRAKTYEKLGKPDLAKQDLEMAKKMDAALSRI